MTRFMLSAVATAAILTGCATAQENPNYQYSTKYKAAQPTSYASSSAVTGQVQAAPVSYQSASSYHTASHETVTTHRAVDQACLRKEQNRELLGGAIGGAVGAIAGKKIIGGTAGTVVGAGLGGTLGYGIGDKSVNCDPVTVTSVQPAVTYQEPASAQTSYSGSYTQPASHVSGQNSFICPVGTTVQADGSCLAANVSASSYAQPVQQQATYEQPSAQVSYVTPTSEVVAPTDSYYQGSETQGTPGYQALQAQTYETPLVSEPVAQPVYTAQGHYVGSDVNSGAQSVAYDYSENLVQANAATTPIASESYVLGGTTAHAVMPGDTVYSLSRKLCVGVNDIQSLNGLGHDYSIKIGDSLNLPASRC